MQNIQIASGHVCCYFFLFVISYAPVIVIKERNEKTYFKYFNLHLWPYHLAWFVNSIFIHPAYKAWTFEKFVFS